MATVHHVLKCTRCHKAITVITKRNIAFMIPSITRTLPRNVIVRLPLPWNGNSQGQETFLVPSADKQTRNYDTECSKCQDLVLTVHTF